jgi:hypothetical protein
MSLRDTYLGEVGRNKREVRDFLFFKMPRGCNKVIGLAGPDIQECLNNYKRKGYTGMEIWERNKPTLLLQLSKIKGHPIKLVFGDIFNATPNLPKTVYDLDYCVTIKHMTEHIRKFMDGNCIMTFSLRCFKSLDEGTQMINLFVKARREKLVKTVNYEEKLPYKVVHTNKGKYIFITYTDTSRMCCFAKI